MMFLPSGLRDHGFWSVPRDPVSTIIAAIGSELAGAGAVSAGTAAAIGGGIDLATAGLGTAIGTGAASTIAAGTIAAGAATTGTLAAADLAAAGGAAAGAGFSASSLIGPAVGAAASLGGTFLSRALMPKARTSVPTPIAAPPPPTPMSHPVQAAGVNVYAQAAQQAGRASTILTSGLGAPLPPSDVRQKTLLGQ